MDGGTPGGHPVDVWADDGERAGEGTEAGEVVYVDGGYSIIGVGAAG
jgi:hypothetical protein